LDNNFSICSWSINTYRVKKIIYISLLITSSSLFGQDLEINKSPNAYRIIATNIASVSLDAIGDALRDESWATGKDISKYGHVCNAASTGLLLTIPLGQSFTTMEWITMIASYTLIRAAIFDPIYNKTRGLPFNYVGSNSYWDKALTKANGGDGFIMARVVFISVGISLPLQDLRR